MKSYLSVKRNIIDETVIEKSRFICTLKKVDGEDEAKAFVLSVKQKYPDATHNCYAYIADEGGFYVKFSDDGEPQGTAGLPMLETLKSKNLKRVAVVVTRYFGGIKLGTGGLARAYSGCVAKAIDLAGISKNVLSSVLKTQVSYSLYPKILKLLETEKSIKIADEYLDNGVAVTFAVPVENKDDIANKITDYSSGKSAVLELKTECLEYL